MKKSMIGLLLVGLLLIGSSAFAADGDVLVNGRIAIGTTNPAASFHMYAPSSVYSIQQLMEIAHANSGHRRWAFIADSTDGAPSAMYLQVQNDNGTAVTSTPLSLRSNGKVGINGVLFPAWPLEINGSAYASGTFWSNSDVRWKKDIAPLQNSLTRVLQLQGVSYNMRKDKFPKLAFDGGPQVGLIAQDVEKVVPEVVATRDDGFKAISYEKLIPLLIEAIKEQQAEINDLKAKLK